MPVTLPECLAKGRAGQGWITVYEKAKVAITTHYETQIKAWSREGKQ